MPFVTYGSRYADTSNLEVNRWGVPVKFVLRGGGSENDVKLPVNALIWDNKLSSSRLSKWSHLNNKILTMSVDQSSNMNKSSSQRSVAPSGNSPGAPTKSPGTSMQNVPASNANGNNSSWAQVAGKGIPSGGVPSDEDKLQTIKEALLSTEGWGGENVNQDSSWDLPPSPEPNKDHSSHPKAPVNDGCELWKNAKACEQGSSTPNASAWNQTPAPSGEKSSDGTNSWFAYPPISQQWRPHPPEQQNNMLMGTKNTPNIEELPFDWQAPKNPITTSVASVPNMPLPSTGGNIPNPNSYSMGPFPHVDAPNLAGQSAGSGMNVAHKMSNAHVLVQEQPNSSNSKENRAPGWDGMVSMPKDGPSNNWGGVGGGPQPMNHHKWIGLPNHSLPERHMVTSSNQAPIMAPPLPHGLIKPDQIMWSQINPGGDYHHDMMSGGNWGNNSISGGPPNYKSNSSIPEPSNEDFDLSAIDPLKKMNQESSQPLPAFVSQIQLAVQAGFLNAQILQQPLAPNSLLLLNQMLSSVALLHKLLQQQSILQPQIHVNKNAHQQFVQHNIHINKTKQQIQHLQNQISNHQDMYMKHQSHPPMRSSQPGLPQNMMGSGNPQQDYKNNLPDHFLLNFNQMNMRDSNSSGPVRSQMPGEAVKWKQGIGNHYSSNMLRDHSKHNLKPHASANQLSYFGSDSSWPQNKSLDHGWSPHMVNRHGVPTPPSNDPSGSHESPWSSGHHQPVQSFDLDIKPFEPGKPWMMKNLEDGFDFGGAAATSRPSLGLHDNDVLGTKVSSNADVSATLSSLPLNSSTWSFNPSSQSSNANNSDVKVVAQNLRAKESWNEGPRQSDLWPPQGNKGAGSAASGPSKTNSQSWGAIGRSTSWAGPSRTTTSSALSQNPSWSSASTWLILKNLTPEIDGSTLKTLCMQHGPLLTFHLYLSHGFALVNYGTHEEAMNAQNSLNNCLLSNTTILAEFAGDFEVNQLLGSGQGRGTTPTSTSTSKPDGPWASGSSLWNAGGGNSSLWSGSSYADGEQQRSTPSSLKSYLPDGLLNSETI